MLAEASSVVAPSSKMSPPPCCPPLSLKFPEGGEEGLLVMSPANPGESAANSRGLRISPPKGRGSDSSTAGAMEKPRSEDSDSRCEASLVTVTVVCAEPTFNCAVTLEVLATSTTMPTWLKVSNPEASTWSVYVPGGSSGNENSPSEVAAPLYVLPVLVSTRLRVAPGTAAPFASFTTPVKVPRPDWAVMEAPVTKPNATNSIINRRHDLSAVG